MIEIIVLALVVIIASALFRRTEARVDRHPPTIVNVRFWLLGRKATP